MKKINKNITLGFVLALTVVDVVAHDTTHVHPMITKRVSDLISVEDLATGAYLELYFAHPLDKQERGLYWGKDRDLEIDRSESTDDELLAIFIEDNLPLYGKENLSQPEKDIGISHYNNVMDGVVQEDAPVDKVLSHFYHATSGEGLSLNEFEIGDPSADKAMAFFADAIEWYNGYTEESKKVGYFKFGQSLHHVEDMSSPAHTLDGATYVI